MNQAPIDYEVETIEPSLPKTAIVWSNTNCSFCEQAKKLLTIKLLGLIAVSSLHAQQEISFNHEEMVIGTKSSAVIQPATNQPVLYINDHEKNFIKATEEEHKKISYCNRYGEYVTNPIIIRSYPYDLINSNILK